jgi:DNA-binding CsgD family transcriptional regulator
MARPILKLRRALTGFVVLSLTIAAGSTRAETVQQTLSELANASPSAAQLGLRSRGYTQAASDASGDRAWQYWWNAREKACVVMATAGSRVERLAASSETDCNQMDIEPSRMTSQGKVAVAAARQLGVSSLMHKTHQRDTNRYNNTQTVADFERGYRDALDKNEQRDRDRRNTAYADGFKAGQAKSKAALPVVAAPAAGADYQAGFRDGFNKADYRDRDRRSKAYADGYKAGQARNDTVVAAGPDYELGFRDGFNKIEARERERKNKRYAEGYKAGQMERDGSASVAARPGTGPVVRIEDLLGRRGADVDGAMKALGYSNRGGLGEGRQSVTTWRGTSNDDCVRIVVREGTVKTTRRIDEASCR